MSTLKKIIREVIKEEINKSNSVAFNYDCLNRSSYMFEAMKKGFSNNRIQYSREKEMFSNIINEGIDYQFDADKRGGIIVFSTEVNAKKTHKNAFINALKNKLMSWRNRLSSTKKIDTISAKYGLLGWTIGHYLDGRYTAKNGKQFGENSLSVEIIGVDSETLKRIAEDICHEFNQETVLLKDYSDGSIYLMNAE